MVASMLLTWCRTGPCKRLPTYCKTLRNCEVRRLYSNWNINYSSRLPLSASITSGFFAAGVGLHLWFRYRNNKGGQTSFLSPAFAAVPPSETDPDILKNPNFIADVVEKAAPSVVYIEIRGVHPFYHSYGKIANGSGFIVDENGLIITNAHVVANKASVAVRLHDGRKFDGKVEAVDPISDLATIKIDATGLPVMKLGNSSLLRAGEWVIAMGSPLSLSNTVTCGIISSINRGSQELGLQHRDMDYIQTDAVINFGNSGGPLVNLDGEAIGINTMKVTTGISFAIPSDAAKSFLERVDAMKKQRTGWLSSKLPSTKKRRYIGITMLTLTQSILRELYERLPDFPPVEHGIFVHQVLFHSPAHVAGIKTGDVIIAINGKEVKTSSDVYACINAEDVLEITVLRGYKKLVLKVSPEVVDL